MPLEITQREVNEIYLLALKGRLVLGQESSGLCAMIDNLLGSGVTRFVINLEHVNYVDSAGLGTLIETHRKTKARGGCLKLCNLGPNLKRALEAEASVEASESDEFRHFLSGVDLIYRQLDGVLDALGFRGWRDV